MKKLANRVAQNVMCQEFAFEWNDWVIDSADGTKKTLGSTVALSKDPAESGLTGPVANTITFDALPAPVCAVLGPALQLGSEHPRHHRLHRGERHCGQGARACAVHD